MPDLAGLKQVPVSTDPTEPLTLLRHCPAAAPTPLRENSRLAAALNVGGVFLKDESHRMGLGSFKALGAAYVIAREAAATAGGVERLSNQATAARVLRGRVYTCASAGNHGLSVAAGARIFGAHAVIYLSHTVPEAFERRLRHQGAEIVRVAGDYETSMAAAARDAESNGWTLLSDSSWPEYVDLPARVMEGYLVMGVEVADALSVPPDHVFLQAGVGGMAAATAAMLRKRWGDAPSIIVVEPEAAPALMESIRAGEPVRTRGPKSTMGRLDCKEPSYLALAELARQADYFATIDDAPCGETVELLARHRIATTPSGAAGIAALHHAGAFRDTLDIDERSRILAFITEAPEDLS